MAWTVDDCMEAFHWRAYTTTTGSWSPEAQLHAKQWCQANAPLLNAQARQIEQQRQDQQVLEFVGLVLFIVVLAGLMLKFRSRIGAVLRKVLVGFLTLIIGTHHVTRDFAAGAKREAGERLADRARR